MKPIVLMMWLSCAPVLASGQDVVLDRSVAISESDYLRVEWQDKRSGQDGAIWIEWPIAACDSGELFLFWNTPDSTRPKDALCFYMRPKLNKVVIHAKRYGHEYRTRWELVK